MVKLYTNLLATRFIPFTQAPRGGCAQWLANES